MFDTTMFKTIKLHFEAKVRTAPGNTAWAQIGEVEYQLDELMNATGSLGRIVRDANASMLLHKTLINANDQTNSLISIYPCADDVLLIADNMSPVTIADAYDRRPAFIRVMPSDTVYNVLSDILTCLDELGDKDYAGYQRRQGLDRNLAIMKFAKETFGKYLVPALSHDFRVVLFGHDEKYTPKSDYAWNSIERLFDDTMGNVDYSYRPIHMHFEACLPNAEGVETWTQISQSGTEFDQFVENSFAYFYRQLHLRSHVYDQMTCADHTPDFEKERMSLGSWTERMADDNPCDGIGYIVDDHYVENFDGSALQHFLDIIIKDLRLSRNIGALSELMFGVDFRKFTNHRVRVIWFERSDLLEAAG